MNFARYLRHLIYRNPQSNYFCSTEKYFTNKIVKSPPRKKKKKLQTLIKKNKTERNTHRKKLKHYLHQVLYSFTIQKCLYSSFLFIHPFILKHVFLKTMQSQDLPTSENYFSPSLI